MKLTIGEFLAEIRKEKGYTQREVAEKLGISNRTLSAWEQGRAYPDILTLSQLSEIYGVTADEILKGERAQPEVAAKTSQTAETSRSADPAERETREDEKPRSLGNSTGVTGENHEKIKENNSEIAVKEYRESADKFSLQSKILAAVHCCGALILSMGFVSGVYITWLGILLIVVGVCTVVVSGGLLAAFSDGALKKIGVRPRTGDIIFTADQNRYALAIGKSNAATFLICGAVWCVFALVIKILLHGVLGVIVTLLLLCFGLLMIIFAVIGSSSDIKKYGTNAQREVNRKNHKLLKKCVGFTAIPVAIAVGVIIFSAVWRQTEVFVDFKGERDGMVAYMHTAVITEDNYSGNCPAGEYVLDLSEVTAVDDFVRVHQYFYAVLREGGEIELFTAETNQSTPPEVEAIKPLYFDKVYPIHVKNEVIKVYDVRYGCKAVEYSNVESTVEIEQKDGEYTVTRTEKTDYTFDGLSGGVWIIIYSVVVCTAVYFAKRKRLPAY